MIKGDKIYDVANLMKVLNEIGVHLWMSNCEVDGFLPYTPIDFDDLNLVGRDKKSYDLGYEEDIENLVDYLMEDKENAVGLYGKDGLSYEVAVYWSNISKEFGWNFGGIEEFLEEKLYDEPICKDSVELNKANEEIASLNREIEILKMQLNACDDYFFRHRHDDDECMEMIDTILDEDEYIKRVLEEANINAVDLKVIKDKLGIKDEE